ncbi:MAG: hypothetical protein OSJ74_02735 [Clostridia bacterium]|nr:hypothetical protein [Clostridia bacterium]
MKNKIFKSSIVVVLLLVMAIALLGCCNCPKDDGSSDNNINAVPEYDTVFSTAIRICHFNEIKNWDYTSKLEIVTSLSDLEKFNILGEGYTEEYFEYNVILLIEFTYASSDDNIQFKDLAIKGHKFYPIFETNSPLPNQPSTADEISEIFVVTTSKRIMSYQFEDILVINRRDVTAGSCYHESITTVFQ